jgi:hypothetical protein
MSVAKFVEKQSEKFIIRRTNRSEVKALNFLQAHGKLSKGPDDEIRYKITIKF